MGFAQEIWTFTAPWVYAHGIKITGIVIASLLLLRFSGIFIEKIIRRTIVANHFISKTAEKKREDTLVRVFSTALSVFMLIVAGMMILAEFGVNTTPLLASAGIIGLAVGFGGQYLIKDVINGFFIILENQYRVGDVACFNGTCGIVEDINLRITTLRDLDGTVHYVPNGEIKIASNLTKHFANVNLNVGVSYNTDLEKAIKVINNVGNNLADDPEWKELIRKPPQFLRVDDFADSAIIVKILGETEPIKQWDVAGELRKRLIIAFDKENIEIPLPQRVIHKA